MGHVVLYYAMCCYAILHHAMLSSITQLCPDLSSSILCLFLSSRFMREERLREGLERARKQRVDLEGALLERDSQAMEIR